MDERLSRIYGASGYVRSMIGDRKPQIGIVLGSGLGSLADSIRNPITVPYRELPGFPVSTALGHKGVFIAGELGGKKVLAGTALKSAVDWLSGGAGIVAFAVFDFIAHDLHGRQTLEMIFKIMR